jgi:hypothetical protein
VNLELNEFELNQDGRDKALVLPREKTMESFTTSLGKINDIKDIL